VLTLGLLRGASPPSSARTCTRTTEGPWELRQMLIDLAAAAEEWAATLPEPSVLTHPPAVAPTKAAA
jgi:hypothetical protein